MAKYAFAPLQIDHNQRGGRGGSSGKNLSGMKRSSSQQPATENGGKDQLVQQRKPACVAICVLLTIVFVLSKGSGGVDLQQQEQLQQQQQHHSLRAVDGTTLQIGTTTVATKPSMVHTDTTAASGTTNMNMVPEAAPENLAVPSNATASTSSTVSTEPATAVACPECSECPPSPSSTINMDDPNALVAKLRQDALDSTPPHINECSSASTAGACHLPQEERFTALGQKGATLWMTGCSGAGQTTVATALEDLLVKQYGKHVYRLDGNNLRTGLNRDLTFTEADRAESVRRTGELATLFSDAGVITLVGLESPYRGDRDMVRKRHEDQGIPFYEIFLDVPMDSLKSRDPKGQYERVESGELKHLICIDDPYEQPLDPEIVLKTHELRIEQSALVLLQRLEKDGVLMGSPKMTPPGLPDPGEDQLEDLPGSPPEAPSKQAEAVTVSTNSTIQQTEQAVVVVCPECPQCPAPISSTSINMDDANALVAKLRQDALDRTPPHIIECSSASTGGVCHLPQEERFTALGQKGATLWMTGCSGAGKTPIATALEDVLVKQYGKHVYRLDGDNLRTGLNRDLGFSEADRAESVRRTGEVATLFSDAGVITLVGLVSPYRGDRDLVRQRHEDQGIPFYEVFLDIPLDELKSRDPKGQYARVQSGELKHFTCIDDPFEEPLDPEIILKTHELEIEQSTNIMLQRLEKDGILMGSPKVTPSGLPSPGEDQMEDLLVSPPEPLSKQAEDAAPP